MSRSARRVSWGAMGLVLAVVLGVGAFGGRSPRTLDERVESVAATIKCPTCRSQSAADSDAPASVAIRREIRSQLEAGRRDGEIREYFSARYGDEILLTPPSSGVASLVWALPVAGLVLAMGGVAWAFVRWRRWA